MLYKLLVLLIRETQTMTNINLILLTILLFVNFDGHSQVTISPSIAVGKYTPFNNGGQKKLTAMLNVNAGYMFTVGNERGAFYPLTEFSVMVPLDNDHPVSFALLGGAYLPVFERFSFALLGGMETHLQQLYDYSSESKDGGITYPVKGKFQLCGRFRIMRTSGVDEQTKLFTEFAYDQTMPLLKFGMFITITKRS